MKTFFNILLGFMLFLIPIQAQTIYKSSPILHLKWNANTEKNIVGYYIAYGTKVGEYTSKTDIVSNTNIIIPYLEVNKTYHIVVRAVDSYKLVSEPSDPIRVKIVDEGFPLPPIDISPVNPTRFIDVLESRNGGPFKSIGMVPYPNIPNTLQTYNFTVITENGKRYVNVKMSTNNGPYKSIGKVLAPQIPKVKQKYDTKIIKK